MPVVALFLGGGPPGPIVPWLDDALVRETMSADAGDWYLERP